MLKAKPARAGAPIPLINLIEEYRSLKKKIDAAVIRVLSSGSYVLGEEARRLEDEVAAYCSARFGIGVNSGTDAILLALRALDIGPGDEVLVPAMTFIATAEPVVQLGATPVFVDIEPTTYTIDPKHAQSKITSRTKALIAVHLYGQPADMDALSAIAAKHDLPIIEDMAQAIGAEWRGRRVGGLGRMACLSFYPTKNLGAYGDAGMILTSDESLAFRLRRLRNHGARVKYDHEESGYNSRLDELQAAVLRIKLTQLDRWNQKRTQWAEDYDRLLKDLPLRLPYRGSERKHVFHLYSVCTPVRDALNAFLHENGIHSAMHYPKPLHLQTAFKYLAGKPGDYPHSERLARETLSLPLYPQLSKYDIRRVAETIERFFDTRSR
jgi:dTDP-4-amino-4,6-dideoxygalactose transaminase